MASNRPVQTAADKKADTNNDGVLSQKEQRVAAKAKADRAAAKRTGTALPGVKPDRLTKRELRSEYKMTAAQLAVDDDLFDLFQKAWEGQWTKERFQSEMEQTPWYRQNQASMREYLLLKAAGGADWEAKRKDSFEYVRQQAMKQGVNLDESTLWDLTDQSMMYGWGEGGNEYELQRALGSMESVGGTYGGDIASNADNFRAIAQANNVQLDESWYISNAKAVASGLALPEDVEREIRQHAADKVPLFGEQIMNGQNLQDLASPWRRMMADEWELADTAIPLDDPTLMQGIGGWTEQGTPGQMSLGDFQIMLRKDPRWLQTKQGKNKTTSTFADVLKMFGMGN